MPLNAQYLRFELECDDSVRQKLALQEISRLYRSGWRFSPDTLNGVETTINGMVLGNSDEKVVRWCLNCLAQLGRRHNSRSYVEAALRQYEDKPEIVAAALAALAHLLQDEFSSDQTAQKLRSIDPATKLLAALQTTEPSKLDLSSLRVNIDTASSDVIKLALIVIGLNRDVTELFDPQYANSEIVRALGQYPDPIVRQYSVWAVLENLKLSLDHLGIRYEDIPSEPPNVQAKMLQLIAEREHDQHCRHEQILLGTYLPADTARNGLSRGLLHQFYDGLADITVPWFQTERNNAVKGDLLEHFARFSEFSPSYEEIALEMASGSTAEFNRIKRGAEGKALYGKLRELDLREGTADLFAFELSTASFMRHKMISKKCLFLAATPHNVSSLRLEEEARDVREQTKGVDNPKVELKIEHRWAVRTDQIQAELLNEEPQILHFSGHGNHGLLVFEDSAGLAAPVSADALASLLEAIGPLECVVLNACYSQTVADKIAPHVQAVIGCNESIADKAAIIFARAFYRAIAHGKTYSQAFNLAVADVKIENLPDEAAKFQITLV